MHDEAGIGARLIDIAAVHDVINRDDRGRLVAHYVLSVFYGTWTSGEPVAMDDCADAAFFAVEKLGTLQLTSGAAEIIAKARRLHATD